MHSYDVAAINTPLFHVARFSFIPVDAGSDRLQLESAHSNAMFSSFARRPQFGVSSTSRFSVYHGGAPQIRHSRTVDCSVAVPLSPQPSAHPLSELTFAPRRDPASSESQHSPVLTDSPNLPQSMSPEPLFERLRKECRSGRSTDAVVFTVMVVCAQAGALPTCQYQHAHELLIFSAILRL